MQNVNLMNDSDAVIIISPDNMQVTLTLSGEGTYSVENIIALLKEKGVVQGINKEAIVDAIDNKKFNMEITVANGRLPIDGEDGRYDMLYESGASITSIPLDGSEVDYNTVSLIDTVKEGQVLANYIPATVGKFGFNVMGKLVNPKKGKDLPPLIGNGITVSQDRKTYTATISGRVMISDGRLDISNVLVINGEINKEACSLKFDSDIIVKGNLLAGSSVETEGDIIVEGNVDRTNIKCGGNLLVKGAVVGGNIEAGKSLYCKSLENVKVVAKENVVSDYIIGGSITCEGKVITTGERSAIVGGEVYAFKGIITSHLGSGNGIPTRVSIGLDQILLDEYNDVMKQLLKKESELKTFKKSKNELLIKYAVEQLEESGMLGKINMAMDIVKKTIEDLNEKKTKYLALAADMTTREIVVKNVAHPKVKIVIDMKELYIEQEFASILFKATTERIVAYKI